MENVISVYTDQDAQDDGMLVGMSNVDRVTRAVWEFLLSKVGKQPPYRWPLSTEGLATYGSCEPDEKAMLLCRSLMWRYEPVARDIYENNKEGGIWYASITNHDDELACSPGSNDGRVVWLLPNEVGGITLMFPEDY